ncbi:MAG: Stp1/IreP family PP2C-type Ser/Thr phosphatase [Faecalibacterium sp.]|nr:Stp1/IreP family PP2C-type Ser/Thr phosphatase [Ruminococcus sp.]MCM1392994.1 Stp1/IreP family PP2C-type Ser/Thr phosphatase [Ruminococcus sp.]MCM1484928.1 Stp1/IreP family PP2C-type Ser/Thr phosphatase [Faecalibacterium sp.]
MKIVGKSDVGMKRAKNEDSFRFGSFEDGVVWAVVCDGMGGAAGGQTASMLACDMVGSKIQKCYNKSMTDFSIENLLLSAITTANVSVFDKAEADESLKGMGTTIVACVIKNGIACIAHVGDSRAYHISKSSITQITKDHSLVQQMLDNGQITREQFDHHPNKNIITRALGIREKIEIDFDTVELSSDSVIVLCTDGLSGCVSDEQLLVIYENNAFNELSSKYIDAANENGGSDNITVVVIKN